MNMTTTRTALRSVAWVNANDHTTTRFCFVDKQVAQAVERPLVHSASLLFAVLFRCIEDVRQVLNHDRSTRRNRLNQLPTDNMIAIQAKLRDFARELFQMSLRAIAAFALKRTLQSEVPAFRVFPGTFTQKTIIRCNSGTRNPKIHTHNLPVGNELYIRQSYDEMQPEPAFAKDQVRTVVFNTLCKQTLCIGIEMQTNDLPTSNSR